MAAQLIDTKLGKVFVAKLDDGSVMSVSAENAAEVLRTVIQVPELDDDYNWRPLEVILEYLLELAEMTPEPDEVLPSQS